MLCYDNYIVYFDFCIEEWVMLRLLSLYCVCFASRLCGVDLVVIFMSRYCRCIVSVVMVLVVVFCVSVVFAAGY